MRRSHAIFAVLIASLALSGCALNPFSDPPNTTFDLTAPQSYPSSLGSSSAQLLVPPPDAVGITGSNRIAVRQTGGVVTVLSGAQWQTDLPVLFQSRLVEAFQRSGRIRGVGRPGDDILSNYQLLIDLRAFEVDAETDTARVDVFCRLMNDRTGAIVASTAFVATEQAASVDAEGYAAALDAAFDRVTLDILAFTLGRI